MFTVKHCPFKWLNESLFQRAKQEGFSSGQFSCSVVYDSLQPHGLQHTRPPCSSPTPRVYSSSCPLSRWCHPTIWSSVILFSFRHQSILKLMIFYTWEGCLRESLEVPKGSQATCSVWCGSRGGYLANAREIGLIWIWFLVHRAIVHSWGDISVLLVLYNIWWFHLYVKYYILYLISLIRSLYDFTYKWNLKSNTTEQKNRNQLIDTENKQLVVRWEEGGKMSKTVEED